jgi:hypothetical protein
MNELVQLVKVIHEKGGADRRADGAFEGGKTRRKRAISVERAGDAGVARQRSHR